MLVVRASVMIKVQVLVGDWDGRWAGRNISRGLPKADRCWRGGWSVRVSTRVVGGAA